MLTKATYYHVMALIIMVYSYTKLCTFTYIPGIWDHTWVSSAHIVGDIHRIAVHVSAVELREVWFANIDEIRSQSSDHNLCRVRDDQSD